MSQIIVYKRNGDEHKIMLLKKIGATGDKSGTVWEAILDSYGSVVVKIQSDMTPLKLDGLVTEFYMSSFNSQYFVNIQYMILDPALKDMVKDKLFPKNISTDSNLHSGTFASLYIMPNSFNLKKLISLSSLENPFESNTLQKYCNDLMSGLKFLRSIGVVHRDIKPGNIVLCNGDLKYVNFGASCKIGQCTGLYGNPSYISPMFIRVIKKGVNTMKPKEWAQNDIFSLGVTIFEMMCRKSLYDFLDNSISTSDELFNWISSRSDLQLNNFFIEIIENNLQLNNQSKYIPILIEMITSYQYVSVTHLIDMIYRSKLNTEEGADDQWGDEVV